MDKNLAPSGYGAFLEALKNRIRETRVRTTLSANRELILLYWGIGRDILSCRKEQGWGAKVIDRLAHPGPAACLPPPLWVHRQGSPLGATVRC